MRIFKSVTLFTFSALLSVPAVRGSAPVLPPIDRDTIVGVWEGLLVEFPAVLEHIEINKTGDSYAAQIVVPSGVCGILRLVSSEITDAGIKLHFHNISEEGMMDLYLQGTGEATLEFGVMDASLSSDGFHPPGKDKVRLVKGAWARQLADTSKRAEECIHKQQSRK